MNLEKELNKYSKEAIIKAITKFAFNRKQTILEDVISEEIEICFYKRDMIVNKLKELQVENIKGTYENQLKILIERNKVYKEWKAIDRRIDKLLKIR